MPMPMTERARARLLVACVAVVVAACGPVAPSLAPTLTPSPPRPTAPAGTGAAATGVARIQLSGAAPDAILLDGDRAWVLAGEGGTLMEVDLAAGREIRAIEVGFGATHLARVGDHTIAVGRFDDSVTGAYLLLVDTESERILGVPTDELGGLATASGGQLWALQKDGLVLEVDGNRAGVVGEVGVEIAQNVHTEIQWGLGFAWAGSDGTPTLQVNGESLEVETVEVPTGIPFLFAGRHLWGAGPSAVWAIDGRTNEVTTEVPLVDVAEILGMDVDGHEAWLAVRRPGQAGRVLRLDLGTGAVLDEHEVSLPAAIRLGPERAWVASYLDDELLGFPR
jgi:hypothetical protein